MFKNGKESNMENNNLEISIKNDTKAFQAKFKEQENRINNLIDIISERFGEDLDGSNINNKIEEIRTSLLENEVKILEADKRITDYLVKNDKFKEDVKKQFKDINKKIGKINYLGITSKFDKKLQEHNKNIEETLKEKISNIREDLYNTEKSLLGKIVQINKNIKDKDNTIKSLDETLLQNITNLNEEKKNEFELVYECIENNSNKNIVKIEELTKGLEKLVLDNNNIKNDFSNNIKEVQNLFTSSLKNAKEEWLKLDENKQNEITALKEESLKLDEAKQEQITTINDIVSNVKDELLKLNKAKQKDFNNLKTALDEVKNSLNVPIQNIEQEIEDLYNTTNFIKKEQESNLKNIDSYQKKYEQYVNKVDNALQKINKNVLSIQEKNKDINKDLQIKIKSYIDNKNQDIINNLNDVIDTLNLSFAEKEKLQEAQMEQKLAKKIKEIQKENERILNKKIQEVMDYIRNNSINTNTRNVENFEKLNIVTKRKKSIFEPIDNNQGLKQTASSNNVLKENNEGKSQILKFFYDDDDDIS